MQVRTTNIEELNTQSINKTWQANIRTNRLSEALRLGLDRIEAGATTLVHGVHVEASIVVEAHVVAATDGWASSRRATGEVVGGDARLVRAAVAAL